MKDNSQEAIVSRLKSDFSYYAASCLSVVDKEAKTVPFVLNRAQRKIDAAINRQEKAGKPVRILVVKARQLGASTFITGRYLWKATTQENQSALIVAHDTESAQGLLHKIHNYYDNLPEPLKPERKYRTKSELYFGNINSSFKISTANNESLGRSKTFTMVHLSEAAYYGKEGEKALLSVLQAVPNKPGTSVIIESTSNGFDNTWYDMVEAAQEGRSDYEIVFLDWTLEDDYNMPDTQKFELTLDEEVVKDENKLTWGQMAWRRYAIENLCQGSESKFQQEYPMSVTESFMYSGHPVFNLEALTQMRSTARSPEFVGKFNPISKQLEEEKEGPLQIWNYPQPNKVYVLGVDVSQGVTSSGTDRDYSVIQIVDVQSGEQVACYRERIPVDMFPYVIVFLAGFYNTAYIVPEVNNHGLAVIQRLRDLKYYRIYRRRKLDTRQKSTNDQLGFQTNSKTKALIIFDLAEQVRDHLVTINDLNTLHELSKFSQSSKGKLGAVVGSHDDTVMALALANHGIRYAPVQRELIEKGGSNESLNNLWKIKYDDLINSGQTETDKWVKETWPEELKRKGIE